MEAPLSGPRRRDVAEDMRARHDEIPVLQAEHLGVEYRIARTGERYRAIRDITLAAPQGSFTAIVGPSGCGKSTFLKAIAGLIPCAHGRLLIDGKVVDGPGDGRAVVFQSPALLPWRDVLGNVIYGLELRRARRDDAVKRARSMIDLVGLSDFVHNYPWELSGGMQQRVNLARALAVDPKILLLDEPFSALDAQTREVMQYELLRIWDETRKTAVFVTHEIGEAVFLADRVAVLSKGPESVIVETVEVPLPRPRTAQTKRAPLFFELVDRIWARIAGAGNGR
ncbi:MAG TPA: ABC transporter ATP-binding protein [Stellaceae bacterium]|nr:ABC transporter ATP-binding protein [Stellaceae bacterium]